jgi:hypothetical protein
MEECRPLRFPAFPPLSLCLSMNVCAMLHARVGHSRPRTLPHHHGVVLPRRARRHPRYDHFLTLSPHTLASRAPHFLPHSISSGDSAQFVSLCAQPVWVSLGDTIYSVRCVESRVVRGSPAMAGRARELRPARSRQNRRREQARQGKSKRFPHPSNHSSGPASPSYTRHCSPF